MPLPLTPLEHNIAEFEKAAIEFHRLKTSKPISVEGKKRLDQELLDRLAHLDKRLQDLSTQSYVQERVQMDLALNSYQGERLVPNGRKTTTLAMQKMMKLEPHHPTAQLRRNMEADGDLAPDENCDCHHIVEGRGKTRKNPDDPSGPRLQTQNAIMARAWLHRYGVGINDPANGVYLPAAMKFVPHWRFPKAIPHANIHTFDYEEMVANKLRTRKSEGEVRGALRTIRATLEHGSECDFLTAKAQTQYKRKQRRLFSGQSIA